MASLFGSTRLALPAALIAVLSAASARAGPKDAQAEKALQEALDVDYLETRFDKAEQKLRAAIDACGAAGCTPALKAKLYAALGAVLAGGKKQLEDATEAFVEALKIDETVVPDSDVVSSEVTYAYDRARATLKLGSAAASASAAAALAVTVPSQQKLRTPVPIFLALPEELAVKAKKVTLSYQASRGGEWRNLVMKPMRERGYGINVPCTDVATAGTLRVVVTVTDDAGMVLASAGTRAQPLTTEIKPSIAGEPPHFPGFAPPETCSPVEKGSTQCIDDRQCNAGLECVRGVCAAPHSPQGAAKGKQNFAYVAFAPDVSIVSGTDVCTRDGQESDHFVCSRQDGTRYSGTPTLGQADNVRTGPALSTIRIFAGYDRVVVDHVTIGGRVGFAFGGASTEGASFLPIHLEARAAYYLSKEPFATTGVRPFLFAAGGLAQVDTKIDVEVLEDGKVCGAAKPGDPTSPCTKVSSADGRKEPRVQTLEAYKQAGSGFAGVGFGLGYAPLPSVAVNAALRASLTFPVLTPVLSPEIAVALGF